MTALSERGPGLNRWSVEPVDIDTTAARVGDRVERRQRTLPDGTAVLWRSVAVDRAWAEPWRCAFMAWDSPDMHPGDTPVVHPNGATGFARLHVEVPDMRSALAWLGGRLPPGVVMSPGPRPGVRSLRLSSPAGEILVG
jgi:hypothetical protein